MQIQPIQNQTFTARNKEIRFADKIMRKMMNEYPAISTSKAEYYTISKKRPLFLEKAVYNAEGIISYYRCIRTAILPRCFIDRVIEDTQKSKIANCGELAILSKGAFLANGFENVKIASLQILEDFGKEYRKFVTDIDHCFLLVNRGKKARLNNIKSIDKHAIIVDPWLGFVDYLHSGLSRYEGLFMKGVKNGKSKKQKFILTELPIPKSSSDNCKNFRKKHPELIVDNFTKNEN